MKVAFMPKPNTHMCDCERQTEKLPPDIAQTKDYWPIVASGNRSSVTSSFEARKELVIPGGHSLPRAIAVIQLIDASKLRAKSDFCFGQAPCCMARHTIVSHHCIKRAASGDFITDCPIIVCMNGSARKRVFSRCDRATWLLRVTQYK